MKIWNGRQHGEWYDRFRRSRIFQISEKTEARNGKTAPDLIGLTNSFFRHLNYHIPSMINITGSSDCLCQLVQRKFMGNDGLQIPLSTGHDFLHIPDIFRHIAARTNDTLLGIGHVQQINRSGSVIDRHRNKTTLNFAEMLEVSKD